MGIETDNIITINKKYPVVNRGIMPTTIHPPASKDALSASSNQDIPKISFTTMETTLTRGNLLGAVRPHWVKVTESEQRIAWLRKMIGKNLIVRDLNGKRKLSISETENLKKARVGNRAID